LNTVSQLCFGFAPVIVAGVRCHVVVRHRFEQGFQIRTVTTGIRRLGHHFQPYLLRRFRGDAVEQRLQIIGVASFIKLQLLHGVISPMPVQAAFWFIFSKILVSFSPACRQ
jgi:hypothetical protein